MAGRLAGAIERMRQGSGGIRWLSEDQFHLTLRFLGSVEENILEEKICPRLAQLVPQFSPITLQVRGVGFFPSPARPRVVWAGVEGEIEPLIVLQKRVQEAVQSLAQSPEEDRSFRPHLTIGRVREPHRRYGFERIAAVGEAVELGSFTVDEILLYKSELTPRGSRYTELGNFKLGRGTP